MFPGAHLVTQIADRVKYGLGPGCHAWPSRVSSPSGEAQLARKGDDILKRMTEASTFVWRQNARFQKVDLKKRTSHCLQIRIITFNKEDLLACLETKISKILALKKVSITLYLAIFKDVARKKSQQ